jgi:hypothetical protein
MAFNLQNSHRLAVLECRVKAERCDHPNDSFLQDVDWLIQELRESWDHEAPKSLDTNPHP